MSRAGGGHGEPGERESRERGEGPAIPAGGTAGPGTAAVKRLLDVTVAALGLLVAAPLLGVIAALVKLDSPGPAFFAQERVGRSGRRFTMWKVRTMVAGAEHRGLRVTARGDPRVTRMGRFLRSTKLDELPQLWNVLKGEMSLVGPRPEVERYVAMFPGPYRDILKVRPGITDEASLAFRHEELLLAAADDPEREYIERILPEKICLYLSYVKNPSLGRDLAILGRTIWTVLRR